MLPVRIYTEVAVEAGPIKEITNLPPVSTGRAALLASKPLQLKMQEEALGKREEVQQPRKEGVNTPEMKRHCGKRLLRWEEVWEYCNGCNAVT